MKVRIFLLLLLFAVAACHPEKPLPEAEKIALHVPVLRLDKDLFEIPLHPDSVKAKIPELNRKYGDFFDVYNRYVLQIGPVKEPLFPDLLLTFLTDRSIFEIRQACDSIYADFEPFSADLTRAWKRYKYFFPSFRVPSLVTVISGLNQSFMATDTMLGISLDKFLGKNCPIYKAAMIPMYQRRVMIPAKMAPDAVRAWMMSEYPVPDSASNLLNHMIQEGKIMYMIAQMFPELPDTLLWGFTRPQMTWCSKNEHQMWTYLVEQKKLFASDAFTIGKFIKEGPFTKDFAPESPARAAVWVGYRIVSAYMNRNRNFSPEALLEEGNFMKILEGSKYDP